MTEDEARAACAAAAPDAMALLDRYVALLIEENRAQNLISARSVERIWARHIWDSLQLIRFAPDAAESWLDVGSGPGLPGLVVAATRRWQVTLAEPRARRVAFLERAVSTLGLRNVKVAAGQVERLHGRFDIISARAVTDAAGVIGMTSSLRHATTRYILPKGRNARAEADAAAHAWHGMFHVEQSASDPDSEIIVADRIAAR